MKICNYVLVSDLLSLDDNFETYETFADEDHLRFMIGICKKNSSIPLHSCLPRSSSKNRQLEQLVTRLKESLPVSLSAENNTLSRYSGQFLSGPKKLQTILFGS